MSDSVMLGLLIAVLLFWAMGAYNRLMRLRSRAILEFVALESLFNQYLLLVQAHCPDSTSAADPHAPGEGGDTARDACAALAAAAQQFAASLKVAHARPLSRSRIRPLKTAYETLCMSWLRLRGLAPDLAGTVLPDGLQMKWEEVTARVEAARAEFNRQVLDYNRAIDQFPALLLAWLFAFKLAETL